MSLLSLEGVKSPHEQNRPFPHAEANMVLSGKPAGWVAALICQHDRRTRVVGPDGPFSLSGIHRSTGQLAPG